MTKNVQHLEISGNLEDWRAACEELIAALEACERARCGITSDAAMIIDIISADATLGPVSVRYVARKIRREMPEMIRLARKVEGWRRIARAEGRI